MAGPGGRNTARDAGVARFAEDGPNSVQAQSGRDHPVHQWRDAIGAPEDDQGAACIGSTTRLVAWTFSSYLGVYGTAYPGAEALAAKSALSLRAVKTHLATLHALGWLEKVEQGGQPGGRRTTLWRAVVPQVEALEIFVTHATPARMATATGEADAPVNGDQDAGRLHPTSESEDASSAREDATSAREDTISAPPAPELEEHVEQEGSAALALAASLVARRGEPDELGAVVRDIVAAGQFATLVRFASEGSRFTWPRQLAAAVRRETGSAAHYRPVPYGQHDRCSVPDCAGGWIFDAVETVAHKCPVCNGGDRTDLVGAPRRHLSSVSGPDAHRAEAERAAS